VSRSSVATRPDRWHERRLDPAAKFGLRATLFGLALVLVAAPFSYLLFEVLSNGPLTSGDRDVAASLHSWMLSHRQVLPFVRMVSTLGKPGLLAPAVAAGAAYAFWRHRARLALYLVVTSIGGGLVDSAVKIVVNRPRPHFSVPLASAMGKSFPSGHTMSSTVTYGALLLVFLPVFGRRSRWTAIAVTGVLLGAIGLSRLMLGVHYLSDVLGGWVLGLAWLAATTAAFSIWRTEEGRPAVHPAEGLEPEAAADLEGRGM